jgi:hypothetical protein
MHAGESGPETPARTAPFEKEAWMTPSLRILKGATLAAGTFAISLVVPSTMSDDPRPAPTPEKAHATTSEGTISTPEREALLLLVGAQLETRMESLPPSDRARLAAAIVDEAGAAEVDPLFVLAMIQVESGFDPEALSGRGAVGLMQLIPSTLHREAERSRLDTADPNDPVLNVRAGVRYYRRLLTGFHTPELALMAYNAGPQRILGYMRAGEIPERFREYPRRVFRQVRRLQRSLTLEGDAALADRTSPRPAVRAAE